MGRARHNQGDRLGGIMEDEEGSARNSRVGTRHGLGTSHGGTRVRNHTETFRIRTTHGVPQCASFQGPTLTVLAQVTVGT